MFLRQNVGPKLRQPIRIGALLGGIVSYFGVLSYLYLLRLSLASSSLPRAVGVAGVYAKLVVATRGITAGAVFATIELRVLLIQWIDEACSLSRIVRNADINDSDVLLRILSVQGRRFRDRNGAELLWRPQTWMPRTRDLPHGS